jgi:hypothetical protein
MDGGVDGMISATGKSKDKNQRRSEGKTKHAVTFSHFLDRKLSPSCSRSQYSMLIPVMAFLWQHVVFSIVYLPKRSFADVS